MKLDLTKDKIHVIDEFLQDEDYEKLVELISNYSFKPGWKSHPQNDPHGHWNTNLISDNVDSGSFNFSNISDHFNDDFMKSIWEKIQTTYGLENKFLIRCYVNAHTYGTEGYSHNDSEKEDEWTIIFYLVKNKWYVDWAGETVVFAGDDIIKSVLPKKNRAFIIPSRLHHAARSVSRICGAVRTTLMFKFRNRRSNEYEKLLDFLCSHGANKIKHSDRSLHVHLMNTFEILRQKKQPIDFCYAGGLHSIFGTNIFKEKALQDDQKHLIVENFGQNVLNLIETFCRDDRPMFFEKEYDDNCGMQKYIFEKLQLVEAANQFEQKKLTEDRFPNLYRIWNMTTLFA